MEQGRQRYVSDPPENVMHLTFTCTAMPRPDIMRRTLESLRANLGGCAFHESTLIVNIDPMVDAAFDEERQQCMRIAESIFGSVIGYQPSTPNFALALRWVWLRANDEFIVHWEDDWELCAQINVGELIELMRLRSLDHVLLRAWRWCNYPFCLGPGILRRSFYRRCAEALLPSLNPEMAIRNMIAGTGYLLHVHPPACDQVVLRDLGRAWVRNSPYVRGKGDFVTWQRRTVENSVVDNHLADQNAELPLSAHAVRQDQGSSK